MADMLKPYEKAGRVIRLFAWITLTMMSIASIGILLSVIGAHDKAPSELPVVLFIIVLLLSVQIFSLFVGKAIKEHKDWGRTAGIVYGILYLIGFPIGTIIGAYLLWCLIKGWDQA